MARNNAAASTANPAPAGLPSESVVLDRLRDMQAAEKKRESANGEYRAARKAAKGDRINLEALDFVQKKLGKYTGEELIQFGNQIIHIAKILRVPVFRDLPLFAATQQSDDDLYREAYERGVLAEKTGDGSNPWSEGTPMHDAFERGRADQRAGKAGGSKTPDLKVVAAALDHAAE